MTKLISRLYDKVICDINGKTYGYEYPSTKEIKDKINEIIDKVNEMIEEKDGEQT